MKNNIFGIEYTAEDLGRMEEVMFSARQFMKTYGRGRQPKIIGDVMTKYVGNVRNVFDLIGKNYTSKTAPNIYVKDVDLYKVTSLTADEVHEAAKARKKGMPFIDYHIYDRGRANNFNASSYEYNLPAVLRYEERLKQKRAAEQEKKEKQEQEKETKK